MTLYTFSLILYNKKFHFPQISQNIITFLNQSMQTQPLELSNIVLRQEHYLNEQRSLGYNFQLEPITHIKEKIHKSKDPKQIKQLIEQSERTRKENLLQKIAVKNYRYEMRKNAEKENKKVVENGGSMNRIRNEELGKCDDKYDQEKVGKIYSKNQKVIGFSSTKGFSHDYPAMRKTFSNISPKNDPNQSLKPIKLPQLKSPPQQLPSQDQITQPSQPMKKQPKPKPEPITKVHDIRYFGIEQRTEDFQKIGLKLLKQIKKKYWCYDTLESEEIYDNFQNLLIDQFM